MRVRKPSQQTIDVLQLLARDPQEWRHGYDLASETGLASGTLYPLLIRLCDRGYLDSKWETSPTEGRPPRHLYRLTSAGATYLASQRTPARAMSPRPIEGTP